MSILRIVSGIAILPGLFQAMLLQGLRAQTTTIALDPRATYLRTNNDAPAAPLVVDLSALPAGAGTWLRVGTSGSYVHISGGTDTTRSLIGVFSAGSQVLATSTAHRVPGAIAAGPAFASGPTYYGSMPNDIAEDFVACRNTWGESMLVEVPPGATHLILGTHDSWYQDNRDPNGDFHVAITVLPSPTLPGTGEHLELRSGVDSPATALPPDKSAGAGATLTGELHAPVGLVDGSLYVIVGDSIPTGGPAPSLLPRAWIGTSAVVLQLGVVQPSVGWSAGWSATVPPRLAGITLLLQGGGLPTSSRNGFYETTIAHRIALQ
jgi:hypothetical protein